MDAVAREPGVLALERGEAIDLAEGGVGVDGVGDAGGGEAGLEGERVFMDQLPGAGTDDVRAQDAIAITGDELAKAAGVAVEAGAVDVGESWR